MQKTHWAAAEWRQKDFESGVGAAPLPSACILFYFILLSLRKEHVAQAAV